MGYMNKKFFEDTKNYIVAYIIQKMMRLIVKTCTFDVRGLDNFRDTVANNKTILALVKMFTPDIAYAAVISKSRDGRLLTNIIDRSFPNVDTILVPHNAKHKALKALIEALKENKVVIITPDGPRGPRYEVKHGVVFGAKKAQAHIVPFSWATTSCWKLSTWDKMMIPKPFSTIEVTFGETFVPDSEVSLEENAKNLEKRLHI